MKTIKGLKQKLRKLNDRELDIPAMVDILIDQCGRYQAINVKEQIMGYRLAEKFMDCKEDTLNLEEADYEFVLAAVKSNAAKYYPFYNSQVIIELQKLEKQ